MVILLLTTSTLTVFLKNHDILCVLSKFRGISLFCVPGGFFSFSLEILGKYIFFFSNK